MRLTRYIAVKKYGSKHWPKYSARMTAGNPALSANEVAMRVTLELPDALFEKPQLQASIVVPDDAVAAPIIDATVLDNIKETLSQNLGVDLNIEIVEQADD